jgi:hypothetical protein
MSTSARKVRWAAINFAIASAVFLLSVYLVKKGHDAAGSKAAILLLFPSAFFLSWLVTLNALIQMIRRRKSIED